MRARACDLEVQLTFECAGESVQQWQGGGDCTAFQPRDDRLGPAMFARLAATDTRLGRPATPATLHRIRATLRSALNAAIRDGLLQVHLSRQAAERAAAGDRWIDSGYVFTTPDGAPLHPDWPTRRFRHLVTASGLPPVRLHDLRHGAATLAHEAGADLCLPAELVVAASRSPPTIKVEHYGHAIASSDWTRQ